MEHLMRGGPASLSLTALHHSAGDRILGIEGQITEMGSHTEAA
jgi:hypothetical protein